MPSVDAPDAAVAPRLTPRLTVKRAAHVADCNRATIYAAVSSGALRSERIGLGRRSIRIRLEDLEAWLARR